MPLTLVLGPANSAKAGEVLGAFGAASPRGAVLVVPTSLDARHYTRELAGAGAVFGSVVTFDGLAAEIGRRAGSPGRPLSELQRERVLERALSRVRPASPGYVAAAGALIAELQRALITPQRFTAALGRWAAEDPRREAHARELGAIYSGYARELTRAGRADRELFAWRALDALRAAPGRWGGEAVFFYGFDELTALERDAVETLARLADAEVTVSLTYEPGREALRSRAEAVEELRPLATRVLDLGARDEHYAPGARAVLHHLERSLFEPDPGRVDPGAAVTLLEAGGERAEAEQVAAEVLKLLRDGVPGEEIVVVHRSPARVAPLLGRVFAQYGIRLTAPADAPFGHTPLGRAVLGAARCALSAAVATPGDLLDYLRAPGLLERPEVADTLEADVRTGALTTFEQARRALRRPLPELDAVRVAADPLVELCELGRRLFAAPHAGGAAVLTAADARDARALAALDRARDELAELGAGVPSGAALIELLAGLPVRAHVAEGPGEVLLAEPLQIRARRFRAVFVCGLQEGEFPAPSRPEPFLSDEQRWGLAVSSGLRLRLREDTLARERYLFYAAVSRASERVVLSYRSSDEEGNLALPSPFLADVAELLAEDWPQRRERRLLADVVWAPERAPTAAELERALAAAQAPAAGEEPAPERVLGELALGHVRHSRVLSAGALETYGDCPMRWLVERELRPDPLEPEPEPIVRGNLMHDVLERLLGRLGGPVSAETLERAQAILTELLDEAPGPGAGLAPGRPDVMRAGALRAIEADLRRYLEHEAQTGAGPWRSEGLELRFGFDPETGSLPPLELQSDGEGLLLRGMIDRIDVDPAGRAIVRDYKSGATRPEHQGARWSGDRRLQVALYMLVVRELLGREAVGGFYQPLRGDDLRARGIFLNGVAVGRGVVATDGRERDELDAELDDAAGRAVALAAALRGGGLTPCPQTCSRDGCAYPGICRS
jgi:RecB family exonuclease/superfamily I DNA/RNA helicase